MSVLIPSYYNCWMMFDIDIGVGIGRETLVSIAIAINQKLGAHEEFLKMARQMAASRSGVY